ncbi:hypothetical protein PaG_00711 [Moesziomyces aphidis]|nr:hypothetical protein PaG_00711 [Moesziomyces aphidis]
MGVTFSSMFSKLAFWNKNEDVRILMLGLDSAGKTTILYRLQIGEVVSTIPTIGFNVETVTYKNIKFQVWDLGGQTSIRPYWRCYYANTAAIIYVIDASDTQRLGTAKAELLAMLSEEELRDSKLLLFANKQDLPGALDEGQVSEKLGLSELKDRQWSIHKCCATKGEGLEEGLDCFKTGAAMQSTSAAIAAAAISGADLGARANSSKGSSAATIGSNGFDASEAEAWVQARWKSVQTSLNDKKIPDTQRPEVYKAAPGTGGSAWGPNKKTVNERFANDLVKASTAAASQ